MPGSSWIPQAVNVTRNPATIRYVGAAFFVGIALAFTIWRVPILALAGEFLVVSEPPETTDIIYVLAGDPHGSRVLVGAELGRRGYAKTVVLSGGRSQGSYDSDVAILFAQSHGYPKNLFLGIPLNAQSTIAEALEMRRTFKRLRAKRIILVTSSYHTRRAALVFRLFSPGFQFSSVAAPEKDFHPTSWWKTRRGRRFFFSEYSGILGTLTIAMCALVPMPRWL